MIIRPQHDITGTSVLMKLLISTKYCPVGLKYIQSYDSEGWFSNDGVWGNAMPHHSWGWIIMKKFSNHVKL